MTKIHGDQMYWVKYADEQYKFMDAQEVGELCPLLAIEYFEKIYLTAHDEIASEIGFGSQQIQFYCRFSCFSFYLTIQMFSKSFSYPQRKT